MAGDSARRAPPRSPPRASCSRRMSCSCSPWRASADDEPDPEAFRPPALEPRCSCAKLAGVARHRVRVERVRRRAGAGAPAPARRAGARPSTRQRAAARRLLGVSSSRAGRVDDHRRVAGTYRAGRRAPASRRGRRAAARPARRACRWTAGSVGSNRRIDSISSPKNSTRAGSACAGEKMSTMPPAHAPLPDLAHGVHPLVAGRLEAPRSAARGRGGRPAIPACASRNSAGGGSGMSSAAGVATMTSGSPASSRRQMTARSASASRCWPPRQRRGSSLGELGTGAPKNLRSCAHRCASAHRADDDDGADAGARQQLGDDERAGGAGEPGDAQADSPSANVFANLERLPSFNIAATSPYHGVAPGGAAAASGRPWPGRRTASPARSTGPRS